MIDIMPIPWISLLKIVPWTDVIASAPSVADKAKKLWKGTINKNSDIGKDSVPQSPNLSNPPDIQALEKNYNQISNRLEETIFQINETNEVLKALSEQNSALILHTQSMKRQLRFLSFILLLTIALSLVVTWLVLKA